MERKIIACRIVKVRSTSRGSIQYVRKEFSPNDTAHATRFDSAQAAWEHCMSLGWSGSELRFLVAPADKRG